MTFNIYDTFIKNWMVLTAAALPGTMRKYEDGVNLSYERADHWDPPASAVNSFLISMPPNLQRFLSPHC